jgi:hypothetical protein
MPSAAMKVSVLQRFDPSRLNLALASAFGASVRVAVADAKATSPSKKMAGARGRATSATEGYIAPTGLGHVFEKGRKGGYTIAPGGVGGLSSSRRSASGVRKGFKRGEKRQALKFRDGGGYAASAIGGPMPPRPYLQPAGARWALSGYNTVARRALQTRGFR